MKRPLLCCAGLAIVVAGFFFATSNQIENHSVVAVQKSSQELSDAERSSVEAAQAYVETHAEKHLDENDEMEMVMGVSVRKDRDCTIIEDVLPVYWNPVFSLFEDAT